MKFAVIFCLTLLGVAGAAPSAPPYEPLSGDVGLEAELLTYTNAARAENAAGPLSFDEGLAQAARHHAAEMASLNYFFTRRRSRRMRRSHSASPGAGRLSGHSAKISRSSGQTLSRRRRR